MQVAHKMNEKLKRLALFIRRILWIFEYGQIKLDLADNAISVDAIIGDVGYGQVFPHIQVNVVPIGGFGPLLDEVVGPTRDPSHGVGLQKRLYRPPSLGGQVVLGDIGHGGVPHGPPRETEGRKTKKKKGFENTKEPRGPPGSFVFKN